MRFIIFGCGSIGSRRARLLQAMGHTVHLFDIDAAIQNALAVEIKADLPTNGFGNYDGTLICTPPGVHLAWASWAAWNGTPFFVEKPLTASLDVSPITTVVRKAQEKGVWAMMGQSYRFLPSLRAFREQFIDKEILAAEIWQGQHLADWRPKTNYKESYSAKEGGGGIVLDSLAHSLDLVNWLFGEIYAVTGLIAASKGLDIEVDDTATLLIRLRDGAQVTVHNDYWQRPRDFHISVVWAENGDRNTARWVFDPAEADQMYEAETRAFVRGVENQIPPQPDIYQGVKNLEWMMAAKKASNTGTWQQIEGLWSQLAGRG